jgi:hypothetical protein
MVLGVYTQNCWVDFILMRVGQIKSIRFMKFKCNFTRIFRKTHYAKGFLLPKCRYHSHLRHEIERVFVWPVIYEAEEKFSDNLWYLHVLFGIYSKLNKAIICFRATHCHHDNPCRQLQQNTSSYFHRSSWCWFKVSKQKKGVDSII